MQAFGVQLQRVIQGLRRQVLETSGCQQGAHARIAQFQYAMFRARVGIGGRRAGLLGLGITAEASLVEVGQGIAPVGTPVQFGEIGQRAYLRQQLFRNYRLRAGFKQLAVVIDQFAVGIAHTAVLVDRDDHFVRRAEYAGNLLQLAQR